MELEEIFDPEGVKLRQPGDDFIADLFLHGNESPLDARFASGEVLTEPQAPEETDAIVIDMAGEGGNAGGSGGANVDFDRPNKSKEKAKAKRLRGRRLSRRKDFKKLKSKFSKKGDE